MNNLKHRFLNPSKAILAAGLATMTIGLGACTESGDTDVTASDVKNQAAETVEKTQQFAQDQIESYKESLRENMNVVDSQIEMLQTHAKTLSGDAKQEIDQAIEDLKTQRDEFLDRIENAKADSQAAWADVKSGLDSAWEELKSSAKDASDRFGG